MSHPIFSLLANNHNSKFGESTSRVSYLDKSRARVVQALHVDYAKQLETALSSILQHPTVTVLSLGESSIEGYAQRSELMTYRIGFSAQQPHAGEIACSRELAVMLIDQLLGCKGELIRQERPLSEIEIELLHDSITPVLTSYAAAWKPYADFTATSEDATDVEHFAEPVYVAVYEIATELGSGQITFVLRLPAWREAFSRFPQAGREKTTAQPPNNGLLDSIGECMLTARALLGSTHISVKDLLGLQVGDIICLDRDPEAPQEIRISNRPKLLGRVRVERGQYIITVEESVSQGDSDGSK